MVSWKEFFKQKCEHIFTTSQEVIDIGGGLRLDVGRGNKVQAERSWLQSYADKVDYKILDPVNDYNPDIVADIHNLPFSDESKEAIVCLAVLEHVKDPVRAMDELYRVLRPGGKLLLYVPFLYYYHAHKGYYGDYWRFTRDTLEMFAEPYQVSEMTAVRLPVETLVRLTPLGRWSVPIWLARKVDTILYKKGSNQVAGYYLYLEK